MKIIVVIERDRHGFGAFTSNTESTIIGEGKTAQEAKEDLLKSFSEVVESYGESLPEELTDPTFEFKYDVSAFFDMFDFINVTRFAKRIGINSSLMRHYKLGDTYISDAQAHKIESGLHEIAEQLLRVRL